MTLAGANLAIKILVRTLNASHVMKTANNGMNSSMNSSTYGKTIVRWAGIIYLHPVNRID